MGRTYERGEAVPAHDSRMVAAWLRADSAAWKGADVEDMARTAIQEAARRSKVNDLAADAIRAMGVTIEDDTGEFVGASSVEEQIRALFAPESLQDDGSTEKDQDNSDGGNADQGGQDAPEEGGGKPAMLTGHLDAADLEKWKKADLEKLAADMGVDISGAKNNAERAAILAAVEVQVPADDPDNGGGTL